MSLRTDQIPTPRSVAANQWCTIDIPAGIKLHSVWFQISEATNGANGLDLASGNLIDDVEVILAKKTQWQCKATELNHMQSVNDRDCAARQYLAPGVPGFQTILPFFFCDPSRNDPGEVAASAWDLNGVVGGRVIDGLQIRLKLGNLNSPVITGFYEYEPSNATIGMIVKRYVETYGAVGTLVEDDLDRVEFHQALHFFPTVDGKYVTQLDINTSAGYYAKERTLLQNQVMLLARKLNPDLALNPAPVYDMIFDYDDPVNQWLNARGLNTFKFKATLNGAAAQNMRVVNVRVGNPD